MYSGRQEAQFFSRVSAGGLLAIHREREERRTKKLLNDFNNPPPNVPEYIAEAGTDLLERWKDKTRRKLNASRGLNLRAPRPGEKDSIVYPPHVILLSLVVRPCVERVANRRTRIVEMLLGTGMSAEDVKLYRSMSRREQKIEDAFPPCPTTPPPYLLKK